MDKKNIRLMVADDHTIFREGLKTILKPVRHIDIVATANTGAELIAGAMVMQPDVVLMDILMPDMDGIEATAKLSKEVPRSKVIALTMYEQESLITDMMDAGAIGYLLKNATKEELVTAIETVGRDTPYFCKEVSDKLTQMMSRKNPNPYKSFAALHFTERDKMIIRMICKEYTSKEIAHELRISKRTVEGHRSKIMDKVGAKSIAGLITYAVTRGIYTSE